jgi:acyl transferase domain-containing protein
MRLMTSIPWPRRFTSSPVARRSGNRSTTVTSWPSFDSQKATAFQAIPPPPARTLQSCYDLFDVIGARIVAQNERGKPYKMYWIQNLLGQVKFADSLRLLCLETTDPSARGKGSKGKGKWRKKNRAGAATKVTIDMLIEIDPHSALAGPIKQILKADRTINIASPSYASVLIRKTGAVTSALSLAASLLTSGYPIDVAAINRPKGVGTDNEDPEVLVDLPPYPWNHSNAYWAEPRIRKVYRNGTFPRTDLLGVLDRNSSTLEPRWRNYLRTTEIPWIQDHMIRSNVVLPAAGYIAMVLEAAFQVASTRSDAAIIGYKLRDLAIGAALIITEQAPAEIMTSMRPHGNLVKTSADLWYEFLHLFRNRGQPMD